MEDTKIDPLIQYRSVWLDGWAEGFGYYECRMTLDKRWKWQCLMFEEILSVWGQQLQPLWCHGNLLCNRHLWCANIHHCVATCMHLLIDQRCCCKQVGSKQEIMPASWAEKSFFWLISPTQIQYSYFVWRRRLRFDPILLTKLGSIQTGMST